MSYRYLARLGEHRLPMFVAQPSRLRRLRRLAEAGHVEVRFYPPDATLSQFCEVLRVTSVGRGVLDALAQRSTSGDSGAPGIAAAPQRTRSRA